MRSHTPYTIVMVDDNIDEIFLTRRVMRSSGFVNRVISEQKPENLLSALDDLLQLNVDVNTILVLLDINMPKVNGFELLTTIRSHEKYHALPVLMLSASGDDSEVQKSEELGANGFIIKPLNRDKLLEAVGKISDVKVSFVQ